MIKVGNVNQFLADAQAKGVGIGGPPRPAAASPVRVEASVGLAVATRVVSEPNARGHWSAQHRRFKAQAAALEAAARDANARPVVAALVALGLPLAVSFTRQAGGRPMDTDNLAAAFKGMRDALAAMMGLDDGDPRIAWSYHQCAAKPHCVYVLLSATSKRKGVAQ